MEFITKSTQETQNLGAKLASDLIGKGKRTFALTGDLGSGKTTFTQGFAEGMGLRARIISPTFILLRTYDLSTDLSGVKHFYHIDLYRLEKNIAREVENLGLEDILKDSKNVVLIEWAQKIKNLLPADSVWVNFEEMGESKRKITVK